MKPWVRIKLEQIAKGRCRCENPDCRGGIGLDAHHALFGAKKGRRHPRPEYDVLENMIMLCNTCNAEYRALDNKKGRLWALKYLAKLHTATRIREWLEGLKATHKAHDEIDYYLRELED